MNDLNTTLRDIAATGFNDPEYTDSDCLDHLKARPGPNSWDNIQPSDFGDYDYEVTDLGNRQVFHPVSNAALQWCYAKLPEDLDRWCTGFVIESKWMPLILRAAQRDRLISEDEYTEAMEEASQLAHQWDENKQ